VRIPQDNRGVWIYGSYTRCPNLTVQREDTDGQAPR
jgi:hypothetical protein